MKLVRDVLWVKLYKNCSKNEMSPITQVDMATKRKREKKEKNAKSFKISFSGTPGVKIGPALGVTIWNMDRKLQNSSSLKLEDIKL